jgi:hypothetical protein
MATTKPIPTQFQALDGGLRLGDYEFIRQAILNLNSSQSTYGITAAGTTQATATPLGAVLNQVDTVTASSGVNLPLSTGKHNTPCQFVVVVNNGANALSIYGAQGSTDTINGIAGSTALSLPIGASAIFTSIKGGAWFCADIGIAGSLTTLTTTSTITAGGNVVESTVGSGFVQKIGTNARCGTFTLNGATTVSVSNTTVATADFIGISMNTPAGTVGALPVVRFVLPGTSFAVLGTASDTSVYNYSILGTN